MKKQILILAATLIASTSALAGEKYICKQTDNAPGYEKTTAILTQVGEARIEEGSKYRFVLELYKAPSKSPYLKKFVFAQVEDVHFSFGNSSEGISGYIYLDELYSAGLTVNGQPMQIDCE